MTVMTGKYARAAAGVLVLLALPAQAPLIVGQPETVYSDAQREVDLDNSRRMVETMLAPSFSIDGQYARWKQPICPHVYGLNAAAGWYVEHHIREVAQRVGAPLDHDDPCRFNIGIFFTAQPQASLESIAAASPMLIAGGSQKLQVKYPVQAWYTSLKTDYNGTRTLDIPFEVSTPAADCIISLRAAVSGTADGGGDGGSIDTSNGVCEQPYVRANDSRLHTGLTAEMAATTVLVDSKAVTGMTLNELGDYLAFLTLAQDQQHGACLPVPTIANLMLGCAAADTAHSLSHVDIAVLTALYSVPDTPELLQKQRIVGAMRRSLEKQYGKN